MQVLSSIRHLLQKRACINPLRPSPTRGRGDKLLNHSELIGLCLRPLRKLARRLAARPRVAQC